ncbi:MAG: surface-adhesin E family protein [Betaproteobacteria bacterium]
MRTLLAFLLLLFCLAASAEWIKVDDARMAAAQKYIDPNDVKQTGPMAIMRQLWEITNLIEPDKDGAASIKILAEYDCQNQQYRILEQYRFTEAWAQGIQIASPDAIQSAGPWSIITSTNASAAVIDIVCPGGEGG